MTKKLTHSMNVIRSRRRRREMGLWTIQGKHFIHTLPHHARANACPLSETLPYMCYLYILYVEMNSVGVPQQADYMYINTQSWFCTRFRKLEGPSSGTVLSLVMMNPQQILTWPGHIFNLWPKHHFLRGLPGETTVLAAERRRGRHTQAEGITWRVCVFMSDSVQCKQLGCCLSPQPSNTVVLFSLSHLQLLWMCF